VDWLQGGEMTLNRVWENSACFTKPGARDKEICICNQDECNRDVPTARLAVTGVANNEDARASVCNGVECPLVNLKKIDENIDFSSACYTSTRGVDSSDSTEKCFSTDILTLPKLAELTSAKRTVGDFQLTNIDGEPIRNTGTSRTLWISLMFICLAFLNL